METSWLKLSRLLGRTVERAVPRQALGKVIDLVLHPTEGLLLGMVVQTAAGEERVFAWHGLRLLPTAVRIEKQDAPDTTREQNELKAGVRACRELLGAHVLTEEGQLLGSVREIYCDWETRRVLHYVAGAGWRKLMPGRYLAGNQPRAYSRAGHRLIVPAHTRLETDHLVSKAIALRDRPQLQLADEES